MNTRSTWWLVLVAFLLSGYVYVSERRAPPTRGPVAELATFDPAAIRALELVRSNVVIRVERATNGWRLTVPVHYGAQKTAVEAFLDSLSKLHPRSVISASELAELGGTNDLKAFGLDESAITVKVESAEGSPLIYQIGGPTPLGEQFYFRRLGAEGVFSADEAFLSALPPTADYWRDRSLFDVRGQDFDRVEVRGPTAFTAVRDSAPGGWRLVKPLPARADGERIEAVINVLQNAQVGAFLTDSPLANLGPLGLQPPESEFILGQGTNDLVRLQFGRVPTNAPEFVLVRRMANSNLVLVPVDAGILMKLPLGNFRDRRLVPSLEGATEIRFQTGDQAVRIERNGTNWMVTEPAQFPADPALMNLLLLQIGRLDIVEFPNDVPADLSRYGLDRPLRSVTVAAGTNELIHLDFGSDLGLDKVYVRRADEPSVYATRKGELLRLPETAGQVRDLRFDPTNVIEVTIEQKGRKRSLARNAKGQWVATTGAPGGIIDEAIDETLYRLGRIESARYVLPDPKQIELLKFPEVDHSVTLSFRPESKFKTLNLQFGGRNPALNLFALLRFDEDPQPLLIEFPGALFEDVFRDFSAP